jgi:hypothetical protein
LIYSTPEDTEAYFHQLWWPDVQPSELSELWELYPSDPAAGSPFDTGSNNTNLSPQFKRIAAIIGDAFLQAPRRKFLHDISGEQDAWGFCESNEMLHRSVRLKLLILQ